MGWSLVQQVVELLKVVDALVPQVVEFLNDSLVSLKYSL